MPPPGPVSKKENLYFSFSCDLLLNQTHHRHPVLHLTNVHFTQSYQRGISFRENILFYGCPISQPFLWLTMEKGKWWDQWAKNIMKGNFYKMGDQHTEKCRVTRVKPINHDPHLWLELQLVPPFPPLFILKTFQPTGTLWEEHKGTCVPFTWIHQMLTFCYVCAQCR